MDSDQTALPIDWEVRLVWLVIGKQEYPLQAVVAERRTWSEKCRGCKTDTRARSPTHGVFWSAVSVTSSAPFIDCASIDCSSVGAGQLVVELGPVGLAAGLHAKAEGVSEVFGTDPSPECRKLAASL